MSVLQLILSVLLLACGAKGQIGPLGRAMFMSRIGMIPGMGMDPRVIAAQGTSSLDPRLSGGSGQVDPRFGSGQVDPRLGGGPFNRQVGGSQWNSQIGSSQLDPWIGGAAQVDPRLAGGHLDPRLGHQDPRIQSNFRQNSFGLNLPQQTSFPVGAVGSQGFNGLGAGTHPFLQQPVHPLLQPNIHPALNPGFQSHPALALPLHPALNPGIQSSVHPSLNRFGSFGPAQRFPGQSPNPVQHTNRANVNPVDGQSSQRTFNRGNPLENQLQNLMGHPAAGIHPAMLHPLSLLSRFSAGRMMHPIFG